MPLPNLQNEYWLLRHGRSKANEAEIIVSKLENGVKPEWSLAEAGKEQAAAAGTKLKEHLMGGSHPNGRQVVCYSSPFSRTMETAQLALQQLDTREPVTIVEASELRERFFGEGLELQSYKAAYGKIWECDAHDAHHQPGNDGESVTTVSDRIKAFFERLEQQHKGCVVLLVSHGDTLSITFAAMTNRDIKHHREFAFDTAELRWLNPALQ